MLFDKGRYRGGITDYGVYQSEVGQQHPTVIVVFQLKGKYSDANGGLIECPKEMRMYRKAITQKTIGWVLSDLKSIGFDGPGFANFDPESPGAVNLFDREIDVFCDHETYQGEVREQWSIYRESKREKVARDVLAQLDAQFAANLAKAFDTEPAAPAPVVTPNDSDETF
jgi:hypothetical protein